MTDDRPEPRYGQYAPIPPESAAPAVPTEPAAPVAEAPVAETPLEGAPRRPGDIVATTLLLLLGVMDVVTGFRQFDDLGDALRAAYSGQDLPAFTSDALAHQMGVAMNIARVVILVAAIVVSLLRIRANRRAVWVPLAGAAVAGIIVVVCVSAVILNDPAFAAYFASQAKAG